MGGDPGSAPVTQTTAQQLQAYTQYLPGLLQATAGQIAPLSQAQLAAEQQTAGPQQQLINNLLAQYGPQLVGIGNQLQQQQAQGTAATNLGLIQGTGGQAAQAAQALQQQLDPQYYAARQQAGSSLSTLLNSINMGGLSGSEQAQVERSNNQQNQQRGILNSPSQTATISNAMNFGTALQQKGQLLNNILGTANNFMGAAQGPVNGFNVATGQANTPNTGLGQFANLGSSTSQANNMSGMFGTNAMNNISANSINAQNINANARDTLDRVTGVLGSLPNIS